MNGIGQKHQRSWLAAFLRYLAASAFGNTAWEAVQLPLYTIWNTGTPAGIALAVLHCTAGDFLIAALTVLGALGFFAAEDWPANGGRQVLIATLVFGIVYTALSEWLNVAVRARWAY